MTDTEAEPSSVPSGLIAPSSSKMDAKTVAAEAGLPAAISALIVTVARRARLWRSERTDLANELIAHFQDGLAADRSPADMIESFGDPRQAAALIRRARLRCRPPWWWFLRRSSQATGCFLLLIAGLYLVLSIRYYVGAPNISHDYLAELTAKARSVPADQRAWPIYREAFTAIKPGFDDSIRIVYRPDADEWPATVEFLREHETAIAQLRLAASMPDLGFVVRAGHDPADAALWPEFEDQSATTDTSVATPALIDVLLPFLTELRLAAKLLAADAVRAALAGDGDTAYGDLVALIGIARHSRETPFIICDLVGLSTLHGATSTIKYLVYKHPEVFTDRQLSDLAHSLSAFEGGGRLTIRFQAERYRFYDIIQRIYNDDGRGDGRLTDEGLRYMVDVMEYSGANYGSEVNLLTSIAGPAAGAVFAGRRDTVAEYDRLMNLNETEAAQLLWERTNEFVDIEVESLTKSIAWRMRYPLIHLLAPSHSGSGISAEMSTLGRDAALVAIALELYHRRNGAWPETLDQLVPTWLPAVPPDRYDGQPLRYRMVDGEPLLYCLGVDRDDDGGIPPAHPSVRTRWPVNQWMPQSRVDEVKESVPRQVSRNLADGDWIGLADGDLILWPKPRDR